MRPQLVRRHLAPNLVHTPPAPPRPTLMSPLHVERSRTPGGLTVLRPVGELEAATVAVFRQAVAEIDPGDGVVVDMTGVPFLDSCGIGALIGAIRRVREQGGVVAVVAPSGPVHRVLNLTGCDRIVDVVDSLDDADRLLDRNATGRPGKSPAA